MSKLTLILGCVLFVAASAAPSMASSRTHFHRRDALVETQAHAVIAAAGLTDSVRVRCEKGRLVLLADGLSAQSRTDLAEQLRAGTDAITVVR